MRNVLIICIFVLTPLLTSCIHNRVLARNGTPADPEIKELPFKWWGLSPKEINFKENELCPAKGLFDVHIFTTVKDGLISAVTLGILAPRTMEYRCQAAADAEVGLWSRIFSSIKEGVL